MNKESQNQRCLGGGGKNEQLQMRTYLGHIKECRESQYLALPTRYFDTFVDFWYVFLLNNNNIILLLSFRRVLNVICFFLGNSPAPEI